MKYLPKNWIYILIMIGMTFLFFFFLNSNSSKLKTRIFEIKGENKILIENNELLELIRKEKTDSILLWQKEISGLRAKENQLVKEKKEIEYKIKIINSKYEKANNFSTHYTSDSILLYFSNL